MADGRLPPFPDDLVITPDKWRAIAFLRELALPPPHGTYHLRRWGQYTGTQLTREDYQLVETRPHRPGG